MGAAARPGLLGFRTAPIASAGLDWQKLDAIWAAAGEVDAFSAGWMSDHLSDASRQRGGGAFESLTTAAALAHRVPGKWIGIAVLANTFRHPALVAKAATVLDNATGGRFILGLGAGWHEGEHDQFGIPLPEIHERFARYESAVATIAALFSDGAGSEPGVTATIPTTPSAGPRWNQRRCGVEDPESGSADSERVALPWRPDLPTVGSCRATAPVTSPTSRIDGKSCSEPSRPKAETQLHSRLPVSSMSGSTGQTGVRRETRRCGSWPRGQVM
jgi:hypothetical protein